MSFAVITNCSHFFHGACLRKWLYVQETCPLCHQTVEQNCSADNQTSGQLATGPVHEDTRLNHVEGEGDQNQHCDMFNHTQIERGAVQGPIEQLQVDDLGCGDNGGQPDEPKEAERGVHGLCFSSTGDFVGFSGPVRSCNSRDFIYPHVQRQNTSNLDPCTQGRDKTRLFTSSPSAVNKNKFDVQSDNIHAKTEVAMCPDGSEQERINGMSSTKSSDHVHGKGSNIRTPTQK